MSDFDVDVSACRGRQKRLTDYMDGQGIDLTIVTRIEHVQWLAGPRFGWTFYPAAALSADGKLMLVCPERREPGIAAADEIVTYQAQWHSTLRNDQCQACSEILLDALGSRTKVGRIGIEFSSCGQHISCHLSGQLIDVEPELYRLRRRKDADELKRIRKAIAGTSKMYAVAREMIRPGVTELDVFNALQTAAVDEFGEMLAGTGNDYQCGSRGGPPRPRPAESGELYILDLGPAFRGYFADNARTIAVSDTTEAQRTAWTHVVKVFDHIESTVKPGKSAKELFEEVQTMLDECPFGVFNHHLGHGIGLYPHEAPHLNPNWDDLFEVGDVFTAEPGLYDAHGLKAGMRIENDYIVTETGVTLLTDFPLHL